jgi:hypothetical protein
MRKFDHHRRSEMKSKQKGDKREQTIASLEEKGLLYTDNGKEVLVEIEDRLDFSKFKRTPQEREGTGTAA